MCSKTEDPDQTIVERFKNDYTEQFYILVRMHLSFLLDSNIEENDSLPEKGRVRKWNLVPFSKKSKLRSIMEGAPLTQEGINQIFHLIQFLKQEENIKSEGIFRRTGSIERQQELKYLLNQGSSLHLGSGTYSVHDCASVLKGFFQDLPDPLLTEVHFPVYCQIAELYDMNLSTIQESKLLQALQLLLLLLPSENKLLLKDLLELLHVTASFETYNRMSPDNLAKLFTPHLLCPRNLTPAILLKVSQSLFSIVSFMIMKYKEVFKIPSKLILEFRAKYEKKRILSPVRHNESTADVASTVFTFVDQECTTKENQSNPTETALAQLYAHIQSLPESSKKRKLVKQFNKENGHGTPLQAVKNSKNISIGDSIKKHIFQKHLARKKGFLIKESPCGISESPLGSPSLVTRARLFCHHNCNSSTDQSNDGQCPNPKRRKSSKSCERLTATESDNLQGKGSLSEPEFSEIEESGDCNIYLTSTPACFPLKACDVFTPDSKDRKSMSPITMSAHRMSRAMQETMMTPRSRKPVLLLSGTNINALPKMGQPSRFMDNVSEEKERIDSSSSCFHVNLPFKSKSEEDIQRNKIEVSKINKSDSEAILTDTFREYLSNRDIITFYSPQDSSFSSRTDDFNSTNLGNFTDEQFSDSLMYCLNGNNPEELNVIEEQEEKKLVLKPKKFDENGKPIIFETSF